MWRLLAGTILSMLPRRWRMALPGKEAIPWEPGATLSGILEFVAAVGALVYWYSVSVTTWAGNGIESALRGGPEKEVPGQAIGFAALALWMLHPLTWFIGYFAIEGAIRMMGAAFTGHVMGTLPLFLTDWVYGKATHRAPEGEAGDSPGMKANAASFVSTIKDLWRIGRLPQVPDELEYLQEGEERCLRIHACRPKAEWDPPRIVRVDKEYYRLEEAKRGSGPRPFVYRLRRLPAGVPGRNVILYHAPASGNFRE